MNWIILVIIGKLINWDYLSSGEQKGKNKPKVKSKKEIVGKQYKICESQILITKGLLSIGNNDNKPLKEWFKENKIC